MRWRIFSRQFLLAGALVVLAPGEHGDSSTREPSLAAIRIFYAPGTDLGEIDRRLIEQASGSLDMAAYVLTNHVVIGALAAAAGRGVRIRIYLDPDQMSLTSRSASGPALLSLLSTRGVEARFSARTADMHLKAFHVDGRILRSGSANFSVSGARHQDNDAIVIESRELAAGFVKAFDRLWSRRDNLPFPGGRP